MADSRSSASSSSPVPRGNAGPTLPRRPEPKKKQKNYLPLRMYIPLEEGRVLDASCVNASNPYHVCGEYCRNKDRAAAASPKNLLGIKEEVKEGRRDVNRVCKYASNPYHKCTTYCLEGGRAQTSPSAPRLAQPKEPSGGNKAQIVPGNVESSCRYASNPYHKCSNYCFQKTAEKKKSTATDGDADGDALKTARKRNLHLNAVTEEVRIKDGFSASESVVVGKMSPTNIVHPDCKYALNPYHRCSDYCQKKKLESNQPKKGEIYHGGYSASPQCRYASNPYHKCSEYCFKNIPGNDQRKIAKPEVSKEVMMKIEAKKVYAQGVVQPDSCHEPGKDRADKDIITEESMEDLVLVEHGAIHQQETKGSHQDLEEVEEIEGWEEVHEYGHASKTQEGFPGCSLERKPEDDDTVVVCRSIAEINNSGFGCAGDLRQHEGSSYSPQSSSFLIVLFSIFFVFHLACAVVNEAVLVKSKDGVHTKCANASDADHQCTISCYQN